MLPLAAGIYSGRSLHCDGVFKLIPERNVCVFCVCFVHVAQTGIKSRD